MPSTLESLNLLLKRSQTVTPFTPEFNTLIVELFPGEADLIESLKDYTHTTRLLETKLLSLHLTTCSPDAIIQGFGPIPGYIRPNIGFLRSAYVLKAGRKILWRCKRAEQSLPIC